MRVRVNTGYLEIGVAILGGGDCVLAWRWLDGYESEARMDF